MAKMRFSACDLSLHVVKAMVISTNLAGRPARIKLDNPETADFFAPYTACDGADGFELAVTERDRRAADALAPADRAQESSLEHSLLVLAASRFLLPRGCIVFHAVALRVNGRAWLLTAPSGTGKTTQYLLMKKARPEAVEIISGDKPILELREDGGFLVHPSPWPGKEGFSGSACAPLAGLVLLRQAKENRIAPLAVRDAVFPIYREFLYSPECEEDARAVARFEAAMLRTLRLYQFENIGDEASARLLFETLCMEET